MLYQYLWSLAPVLAAGLAAIVLLVARSRAVRQRPVPIKIRRSDERGSRPR